MAAPKKSSAKPTAKKSAPKKAAPAKAAAPKKLGPVSKAMNKTEIMTSIADAVALSRKQVQAVFEELHNVIGAHVHKKGVGHFTFPGLLKLKVVDKPATKARKGINPFTGEETVFKAKPASRKVKAVPLTKLKGLVG